MAIADSMQSDSAEVSFLTSILSSSQNNTAQNLAPPKQRRTQSCSWAADSEARSIVETFCKLNMDPVFERTRAGGWTTGKVLPVFKAKGLQKLGEFLASIATGSEQTPAISTPTGVSTASKRQGPANSAPLTPQPSDMARQPSAGLSQENYHRMGPLYGASTAESYGGPSTSSALVGSGRPTAAPMAYEGGLPLQQLPPGSIPVPGTWNDHSTCAWHQGGTPLRNGSTFTGHLS